MSALASRDLLLDTREATERRRRAPGPYGAIVESRRLPQT